MGELPGTVPASGGALLGSLKDRGPNARWKLIGKVEVRGSGEQGSDGVQGLGGVRKRASAGSTHQIHHPRKEKG